MRRCVTISSKEARIFRAVICHRERQVDLGMTVGGLFLCYFPGSERLSRNTTQRYAEQRCRGIGRCVRSGCVLGSTTMGRDLGVPYRADRSSPSLLLGSPQLAVVLLSTHSFVVLPLVSPFQQSQPHSQNYPIPH